MIRLIRFLISSTLVISACGCGSSVGGALPTTAPADQVVKIDNFAFDPPTLTVVQGTKVTWINRDDVPHTATSSAKPRAFNSKALDTDDQFSFVFTTPGTYAYFCALHPHMTATIVVK